MSDLIGGLIVVAVTGLIVGLIFILVHNQNKKKEQAMQMLASKNGWVYEKINDRLRAGYRLTKHDWVIEGINESTGSAESAPGSSNVSSVTRWFSTAATLPQGIVLIGTRVPDMIMNRLGVGMLLSASGMLKPEEAAMVQDIHTIDLGSLEFMQRFMIWTNQDEAAKKLADSQVEACLINWPKTVQVVIRYSKDGIEIKVQGKRLYKEEEISALAKLGNALLNAVL